MVLNNSSLGYGSSSISSKSGKNLQTLSIEWCFDRYWVTQKWPQIYTANHATLPIQIRKSTVQICGNFWVTQYYSISIPWVARNKLPKGKVHTKNLVIQDMVPPQLQKRIRSNSVYTTFRCTKIRRHNLFLWAQQYVFLLFISMHVRWSHKSKDKYFENAPFKLLIPVGRNNFVSTYRYYDKVKYL